MRRLTRLDSRRADERGAVALMMMLLLGGGLLLGCVALSVDLGSLTSQRREIQNAADAVAFSAAQTCATTTCPTSSDPGLASLAHGNDAAATITDLCGTGPGLSSCPSPSGTLADCPSPQQSFAGSYVQVSTRRHTTFSFAPGIGAGNGRDQSTCARAGWGTLGSYSATLPVTFSVCEWQAAVGGDPVAGTGGTYAPAPPYPPNPPSPLEHAIMLESKTEGACRTFNGHDAPGGFGWLTSGAGCVTGTTTGGWVQVDTGNNVPSGCADQIQAALGTVVLIPVYDCMNSTATMPSDPSTQCSTGNGTHLYYHVAGYAGFYLTGWRLASMSQNSVVTGRQPSQLCTSGEKCIFGFFVRKTVSGGSIGPSGTPGFGLTATRLIG